MTDIFPQICVWPSLMLTFIFFVSFRFVSCRELLDDWFTFAYNMICFHCTILKKKAPLCESPNTHLS